MDWWISALYFWPHTCNEYCLHFWEAVGTWFAGIATASAVVVSLMLARRDRIRLTVSAGHRLAIGPGSVEPYPEFLVVTVRNKGNRPATIEGIAWKRRPWRSLQALQLFAPASGYPGPPVRIEEGTSRSFSLPINDEQMRWADNFLKEFVGKYPSAGVHLIRVQVYTPAGDYFYAPLEASLKQWLVRRAKQVGDEGKIGV